MQLFLINSDEIITDLTSHHTDEFLLLLLCMNRALLGRAYCMKTWEFANGKQAKFQSPDTKRLPFPPLRSAPL